MRTTALSRSQVVTTWLAVSPLLVLLAEAKKMGRVVRCFHNRKEQEHSQKGPHLDADTTPLQGTALPLPLILLLYLRREADLGVGYACGGGNAQQNLQHIRKV